MKQLRVYEVHRVCVQKTLRQKPDTFESTENTVGVFGETANKAHLTYRRAQPVSVNSFYTR